MAKPGTLELAVAGRAWALLTTALALLPLLLQLPTALAAGFAVAALAVGALSWRRPLPSPVRLLLILAMLAAIYWQMGARPGRDSGCALLAAMLAIKSSELRTLRDARSLLGFALFAPFAAFLLDQGPLTLGLALAAVLSALLALQRLADEEGHSHTPALRQQLHGVGRLVAIALPLALAAFWLFPRLPSPLWGIPERALARPGLSDAMNPGEWIDLMADDSPALRAQFFGPTPAPEQRYWRGPVLTRFDGRSWTRLDPPLQQPLPAVTAAAAGWDYQIEYEPTDRRQLVALDLPIAAPANARLADDYSLSSEQPLTALTRWRLQSAPARQFQAELPPALRRQTLQLPPGFNPRTRTLARQWRQQAGADDNAIVQRALAWISAEFAYTLDTPLPGRDGVDEFLFQHKAGFCEHFSSAFAVLMRNAGIPARVVTGYAGGERNRFGAYWVVRRMDAHAWTEVWLAGRGWVRVDPTAAVAPERIYDTLEDRLGQGTGAAGFELGQRWRQMAELGDWLRRGWNDLVLSFDANRQQHLLRRFGIERLQPEQLILVFALFAAAALGAMAWLLARGERERDPLLRAWRRLGRRYRHFGLERELHEPAILWASRVEQRQPGSGLLTLSQRFAAARYADNKAVDVSLLRDLRRHRPKPGAHP
ncbi:transglutaminaseTgpA domain-containing protein [Stenotrophomonas sp. YIM B06876]|uniref:transglutaminase family protein n=1 Tax=Stenotrophomonas sp. YIM B06876 TaxID=3060211 RepID=UPI002739B9A6|nr:transglutaminaseTgpA domain-containing protein [Stenotrophomonas sp. YIM B06876]